MIINTERIIRSLTHPLSLIQYVYFKALIKLGFHLTTNQFKLLDSCQFFLTMGKKIDWRRPQDINQWIHYLYFDDNSKKWSLLADKFKVREYVKELGHEDALVEMFASWDNIELIDFKNLPNSFVLKMNNGCGDIRKIKDKDQIDINEVKEYFRKIFNSKYGNNTIENHYGLIEPQILVERLLDNEAQAIPSSTMIDYKFWCFNGCPKVCWIAYNRTESSIIMDLYTASDQWVRIENGNLAYNEHHLFNTQPVPRPESLDKMIEIASNLSKGYPQMRVDLYEENGNVLFGEITMTSQAGKMDYFTDSFLQKLGKWCEEAYWQLHQNLSDSEA